MTPLIYRGSSILENPVLDYPVSNPGLEIGSIGRSAEVGNIRWNTVGRIPSPAPGPVSVAYLGPHGLSRSYEIGSPPCANDFEQFLTTELFSGTTTSPVAPEKRPFADTSFPTPTSLEGFSWSLEKPQTLNLGWPTTYRMVGLLMSSCGTSPEGECTISITLRRNK